MLPVNITTDPWYEKAVWPVFWLSPSICVIGTIFGCLIRKHLQSREYTLQNRLFADWTTSTQMIFKEFYNDDTHRTPLQIAVQVNNHSLVQYLLTRPDLLRKTSDYDGNTALHYAAAFGDIRMLELINTNFPGPLPLNKYHQTPLDIAVWRKNTPEIFKYLSEKYPFEELRRTVLEV